MDDSQQNGRSVDLARGEQERSDRSGRWKLLLGFAVSAVSLVLLLWNVNWNEFWTALQKADYWWFVPCLATVFFDIWLKTVKWQLLLLPAGKTSQVNLLYSICVGYLVNTILPGRLGELARVYMVSRLEPVNPVAVLSTVAIDRILDVVAVALLLAVVLPTADLPTWVGQSGLVVGAGGIALLACCLLMAYPWGRDLFLSILDRLPRFPGKAMAVKWAEALCLGTEGLRGPAAQLKITAVTAAIWIVTVLTFYFSQLAFHIQAPIWAAALVVAVTNLGMVVPSSPGYVGVYHYLVVLALAAYGVEREVALGMGVVVHLVWLLPVCLVGAFALWRRGMTLMGWKTATKPDEGSQPLAQPR